MKKIAVVCACLFLGWAGVSAQNGRTVYGGGDAHAKVTFFTNQTGFDLVGISDDGRFFYGSSADGAAFIYELAQDSMAFLNDGNIGLLQVKDWKNYASTNYTLLNGVRHNVSEDVRASHIELDVETVSGDLKTLFAGYYDKGETENGQAAYNTLRIDAESGEIIDTLAWVYPIMQMAGYINKTFGASEDGKIVVGYSSAPFAFTNVSPVFWDLEAGTNYYVGIGEDKEAGTTEGMLASCNNDGTLLCGGIGDGKNYRAYIIKYDRTARTFERVAVPLWAGSSSSMAAAVSETGIVVGSEDSRTFIYDMNSGEKYELTDYLRYLYGVEIPADAVPFNTTSHISDNGRVIVGTGIPHAEVPYLIELGEHQIHAVVRAVSARQTRGTETVTVNWNRPLIGEYTLKGYWVYRDSVKMNPTMLGPDATSFIDQNVPSGPHTYAVQAVYTDDVAAEYAFAAPIRVTGLNECLPVQEIYSDIVYNRTVNLYWNLPTDKVMAPAAKKSAAKGYQAKSLDVVDAFDVKNSNASSAVRIGKYIYATAFQSDLVTIFDAETGEVEKTVAVENFKGAYDLTAHGNKIYVAGNDYMVRELTIDPENPFDVQAGVFWNAKAGKLTHIAYVEDAEKGDYLALGAYNNIMFYPIAPLSENDTLPGSEKFNFRAYSIGGSEVHDGKLYVANQSTLSGSEVTVFDLATGEKLFTENLAVLPQLTSVVGQDGTYVSGITKCELEDGMVVLQCMVQPRALLSTNYLFNMELESWPETTGYNVYRDGEKINDVPVKARRYSDVVYEPGKYEYTIEYVSNTCTSNSSEAGVSGKVEIFPIGECEKPGAVAATESNGQIIVTWTRPSDKTFVGFNIYRDGEQKVELLRDERWLDTDKLQKDNEYVYRVEAFYNNSCVASDSVKIKPTFQGVAMPPSMVSASLTPVSDKIYDVEVSWELPYFEQPMAYGYCSAPAGSFTPAGVSTVFALIGWDTASIPFFEDLYLVGMEYIIGTTDLNSLDAVVYIDNKIVHMEPMGRYQADQKWNTMIFNKALSTKYATELAVGYIASFDPSMLKANVVVHDAGPGKRAFSDILSFDGKTSTTLAAAGRDVNLCINALIVRRRDLEAAALAPDPAAYLQEKMIKTEMPWTVASSSVFTDAPKTSSESIKLRGFNVYDDKDVKLNETLLTGFKFKQTGLQAGREYGYTVGAQYDGEDEQLAETYWVDLTGSDIEEGEAFGLRIYPNPVGENLYVAGEYRTLFITDLAGKRVGNVMKNTGTVSMSALQSGVYLLHFTLLDGRSVVVKVVKR